MNEELGNKIYAGHRTLNRVGQKQFLAGDIIIKLSSFEYKDVKSMHTRKIN